MGTFTVKKNSGNAYSIGQGWHSLVIKDAKYGDWNGKKFLDLWFEGMPEKMNMRVYEAKNRDTDEEFAINTVLLYANAPMKSTGLKDSDGNPVVEMTSNPHDLIAKKLNVFAYKDGDYHRFYNRVAPGAPFKNAVVEYDEEAIERMKNSAEKNWETYVGSKLNSAPSPASAHSGW
jgi:hypothetical protein